FLRHGRLHRRVPHPVDAGAAARAHPGRRPRVRPPRPRHRVPHPAPSRRVLLHRHLALSIVLPTLIINLEDVGGSRGLSVIRPSSPPFGNYVTFLFTVMVLLAVIAVTAARFIERSWVGRGLAALRDNEEAAECMGVPTLRLKLFATTVSGFL